MKPPIHLLSAILVGLFTGFSAWADAAFTDDFEAASINPFWTVVQTRGTVLPSSTTAHGGQQAVKMTRTTSGQLDLQLTHTFSTPQYGTVSVWLYYDAGASYYSSFNLGNSVLGITSGVGVQDWDGSHFYYSAFNLTSSTVARSGGWHLITLNTTPISQTISLDGNAIYSGTNSVGFDSITITTSGPGGSGSYYYDDFTFTPLSSPVPIQINSLSGNGLLTWTNVAAYSNGLFCVEWAASLNGTWKKSWGSLGGMIIAGPATTVEVPMFYRVKCLPNQLILLPLDFQSVYAISNAVGILSTQRMTMLGYVRPTLNTNEFTLVEQVTTPGNDMGLVLIRSTDNSVYRYSTSSGNETLEFQLGPVGTTWTNFNYNGSITRKVTIEAIENVTVPAGTFSCYKFHKQALEISGADWYEWVCPGIGIVKWVDYWVDPSQSPPITYQLQSFGPRSP